MFTGDHKSYRFRASPVANFGAGTLFDSTSPQQDDPGENMLLDTVDGLFVLSAPPDEKAITLKRMVRTGPLGANELRETDATGVGLLGVMPQLANVIGMGGAVDTKRGVTLRLRASGAEERKLAWNEFLRAVEAGLIEERIPKQIIGGKAELVLADLTLRGFTVHVQVNNFANSELNVRLTKHAGAVVRGDGGVSFRINKTSGSAFDIVADEPVVVAQQFGKPEAERLAELKDAMATSHRRTPPATTQASPDLQRWKVEYAQWQRKAELELQRRILAWRQALTVATGLGRTQVTDDPKLGWAKGSVVEIPTGRRIAKIKIAGIKNEDAWLNAIELFDEGGMSVGRVGDPTDREVAREFVLQADEYVTGITFRTGRYVDWIRVHTNKRDFPQVGENGGQTTHHLAAQPDSKIVGFRILGGTELRNISLIAEPLRPVAIPTMDDVVKEFPPPKPSPGGG